MAYTQPAQAPITLKTFKRYKAEGERFSCVSLYDAAMSHIANEQGVECLLVGDSLGMTIQGHDSTLPVTMEHMVYHTEAVKRGNSTAFIIADMPFISYATAEQALNNAALLMQAGAHMVKLEGGAWLADTVQQLTQQGIPVCAHLGLTPQSVNKLGGFQVQGREQEQANAIIEDAKVLEKAGADILVLECVPSELAQKITETVSMSTIGIGAGKDTDAQVLVINDLVGITEKPPKFSKNFLEEAGSVHAAVALFNQQVKAGTFPEEKHGFKS
jgi:3-methyl-2-oxobutanoate hydroxymethyltransferase